MRVVEGILHRYVGMLPALPRLHQLHSELPADCLVQLKLVEGWLADDDW